MAWHRSGDKPFSEPIAGFLQQITKVRNTDVFVRPPVTDVFPSKMVANAGIPIDSMTDTQHIGTQHGDLNLTTLSPVMACCLTEQNQYLSQCWLIIDKVQWPVSEGNVIGETSANID